jgi:hypothetical protein
MTTTVIKSALRIRIEKLIAQWENSHADRCCTRGCMWTDGRHSTPSEVRDWLNRLDEPGGLGKLPSHPCTGECSCDVGLYLPALREALGSEL